jgi:hypothetical protein
MQPRLHDCADCGRHPEPANELPRLYACRQLRLWMHGRDNCFFRNAAWIYIGPLRRVRRCAAHSRVKNIREVIQGQTYVAS